MDIEEELSRVVENAIGKIRAALVHGDLSLVEHLIRFRGARLDILKHREEAEHIFHGENSFLVKVIISELKLNTHALTNSAQGWQSKEL